MIGVINYRQLFFCQKSCVRHSFHRRIQHPLPCCGMFNYRKMCLPSIQTSFLFLTPYTIFEKNPAIFRIKTRENNRSVTRILKSCTKFGLHMKYQHSDSTDGNQIHVLSIDQNDHAFYSNALCNNYGVISCNSSYNQQSWLTEACEIDSQSASRPALLIIGGIP